MTDEASLIPAPQVTVASPAPAEPGWKDLLKAVGIIWTIELALGILTAVIMLAMSGFRPQSISLRMEYVLPSLALSWTGTLTVAWYFACRKYRRSVRQAFAVHAIPMKTAVRCVFLGIGAASIAGILMIFFANGKGYIVDLALQPPAEEGGEPTLSLLFLGVLLALPPLEEIYYRGFLYPALRRLTGVPVAAIIVTAWFGLIHTPQLFGDWVGVVVVTVMGAICTYLRQRYDSIFPSVLTHFTYNASLGLIGLIGSALE